MKHLPRILAVVVGAAILSAPSYAYASPTSGKDTTPPPGSSSSAPTIASSKTGVSPMASPGSCAYSAYYTGVVSTTLSNGNLNTLFCVNSGGYVTEVHTVYEKTGGSSVTLRNFWEWTNSVGGTSGYRYYDAGAFTASAGHSYPYAWIYYPGVTTHPTGYGCLRGGIRDTKASLDYTTRVFCPGG